MDGNQRLIKQFMDDSKYQDKLDFYDKETTERCLVDYIEVYQDVSSMEDDEILNELGRDILINKNDILKGLDRNYKTQLAVLKKLGVDISEYPKGLEELTK